MRLCREPRACRLKITERGDLGFADKAAGEDAGIRRGRQREAAIPDREPEIVHANRNVEQPRGPKLPTSAAAQRRANATAKAFLTEFDGEPDCNRQRNNQQQDSPATGVPLLKPT